MKIIVCVKHVPDTAATIKVKDDTGFEDGGVKFIANPYDEFGIEEAVRIVEKEGGEVVILTVGKAAAVTTIRSALAMGTNRAILVKTADQFLDSSLTAQAMKAALEKDGLPDLIFTGKSAVDTETFQTPYRLAKSLGLPMVNEVSKLTLNGKRAVAQCDIGGGQKQVVELSLPGVIGATKGLNIPRYPKLPDIMKAKKKEIKEIDLTDLGIDPAWGRVAIQKLEIVAERSGAAMLDGSLDEQVDELIRILKEDEKILS